MTSDQELKIISNIPFLQYFNPKELEGFVRAGRKCSFEKEQVIFNEGETGEKMYIILSGTVEIFKENKQIAKRSSGDYFGEMAMIESKPRSASARALEATELFEIGQNVFDAFLNSNTRIVKQFLQTISGRCRVDLDIIDTGYLEMYKSEERYRTIVETISDIVLQMDPDGKITFVNSAVMILGYSPKELIGKPYQKFMESIEREKSIEDLLTKRIGPRATSNAEIDFKVNEDSPIYEFIQRMPFLVDAHGMWDVRNDIVMKKGTQKKFMGTLCIARDYTERKISEDKIKKRKEELEELVKARTQIVEQAKKEAEYANRAKTEFLSNVSHELRTPLNAILGFTQLLESSENISLPENEAEFLRNISVAGTHLFSLVKEILDLSRIESKDMKVEIESLDVFFLIRDLMKIVSPQALESGITLSFEDSEEEIYVKADETKLRQVILNLLSNAIKYNKENGTVDIRVKLMVGKMVEISVVDTGVGIAEEDHWKVFEPFQRLNCESSNIEGTGIGLTISKRLMELMEGRIGFHSTLGSGSRFFIELPLCEEK